MDWTKVQRGLQFARKQGLLLMTVWHPLSLLETYAAKDIAPVLIESGGLTGNYQERLRRTGQRVAGLVAWRESPEEFLQQNYRQAHELGLMHAAIARSVQPEKLGWVASERRVMNQQAYALVLYTFSQTPALVMEARKMPAASAPELDDWYHLWAVLGYAMGVEEKLLGRNAAEARTIGLAVRKAQFPAPGEPAAPGAAGCFGRNFSTWLRTGPRLREPTKRQRALARWNPLPPSCLYRLGCPRHWGCRVTCAPPFGVSANGTADQRCK